MVNGWELEREAAEGIGGDDVRSCCVEADGGEVFEEEVVGETSTKGAAAATAGSDALSVEARSALLPTRRRVRLGDARARASLRKVGSALKEASDARSYTRIAPAAPR